MSSFVDRRTFLKNSGLALTAASLAACSTADAARPNVMGLDFGSGDGSAEIERASLHRAGKLVRQWEFA